MSTRPQKETLVLNFASEEAKHAVTRQTVEGLRDLLGFSSETQVIHLALATLRDQMMPRYVADDGPVPDAMLEHIKKSASQSTEGGTSLDETFEELLARMKTPEHREAVEAIASLPLEEILAALPVKPNDSDEPR